VDMSGADETLAGMSGQITLADGDGNPAPGRQPIARLTIDLYSLDRLVTVRILIPRGSPLESSFTRGPERVTGWRTVVDTLKRNLDEIVAIEGQRWWRPEDARFKAGQRVRVVGDPNFATPASGTIEEFPPPRRVGPGVLYRIRFAEPQVNRNDGEDYASADVLEDFLELLPEGPDASGARRRG
jgi:hypothetical protein